jgi:hypothetical protein
MACVACQIHTRRRMRLPVPSTPCGTRSSAHSYIHRFSRDTATQRSARPARVSSNLQPTALSLILAQVIFRIGDVGHEMYFITKASAARDDATHGLYDGGGLLCCWCLTHCAERSQAPDRPPTASQPTNKPSNNCQSPLTNRQPPQGHVAVHNHNGEMLAVLHKGGFFGELALLATARRTAQVHQ